MPSFRNAEERKKHNRLVLGLQAALEAVMDESKWRVLGYSTDTADYITGHGRLLRSLHWGDPDYGSCVLSAIERILEKDGDNQATMLEFPGVKEYLQEHSPDLHSEYYIEPIQPQSLLDETEAASTGFDVDAHIRRIRHSFSADPALAIGSTKELLESVFKTILGIHGHASVEEMPKLLKQTQIALKLDPAQLDPLMAGADSMRRLLGGLNHIVTATVELRNLYGTGHGKSNAPEIDITMAQLVVTCGTALAAYLMSRYRELNP